MAGVVPGRVTQSRNFADRYAAGDRIGSATVSALRHALVAGGGARRAGSQEL